MLGRCLLIQFSRFKDNDRTRTYLHIKEALASLCYTSSPPLPPPPPPPPPCISDAPSLPASLMLRALKMPRAEVPPEPYPPPPLRALWGVERPRPLHSSTSLSAAPPLNQKPRRSDVGEGRHTAAIVTRMAK